MYYVTRSLWCKIDSLFIVTLLSLYQGGYLLLMNPLFCLHYLKLSPFNIGILTVVSLFLANSPKIASFTLHHPSPKRLRMAPSLMAICKCLHKQDRKLKWLYALFCEFLAKRAFDPSGPFSIEPHLIFMIYKLHILHTCLIGSISAEFVMEVQRNHCR